jgi:hypothetical protein
MSSYTMTLKEVIDFLGSDEGYSTRDKIEIGRTKLFDFDYPIFNADYKKVFETHFIRKFYMREIGFETEGLFKFQLETWLIINMPYFNKLFESELIQYDPLTNSKTTVTHTKTTDKDQTQTSNTNGSNQATSKQDTTGSLIEDNFDRQLDSDNPDSRLAITTKDGEGVIQYAKNIKENNENNSKTSSGNTTSTANDNTSVDSNANAVINETEDFVQSRVGKIGVQSYSKMLNEYRDSLLRVENKIFNEMQELFMLVY